MMKKPQLISFLGLLTVVLSALPTQAADTTLWYEQPATRWLEALPLGNGRLGAMVFGDTGDERIQLNEESLWAGLPFDTYPDNFRENIRTLQDMVLDGKIAEANAFGLKHLVKEPTSFRSYQPLADLRLNFPHIGKATHYRRSLDLIEGIVSVQYRAGNVNFQREILISAVDGVMAIRLTADQPGAINLSATLTREKDIRLSAGENMLRMDGQIVDVAAPEGHDPKPGGSGPGGAHMRFAGRLHAKSTGGTTRITDEAISIEKADEVLLLFTGATDYSLAKMDFDRTIDPGKHAESILAAAAKKSWAQIRADHIAEHSPIMRRVTLQLGGSAGEKADIPTDKRLAAFQAGENDPGLAVAVFQYGRYLLMSGSRRPGRLPLNLQGIWNQEMWAPWDSDYHLNINLQMNYWPVDVCNLSENIESLVDWFERLTEKGSVAAKRLYGSDGWVSFHATNPFGRVTGSGSTPASQFNNGFLDPLPGAWMAMTLWRHYEFTQDEAFLRERAYPILKGAARFMLDYMREDKQGRLVVVPSTSPENEYIHPETGEAVRVTFGSTYHTTLVRVMFEAVIEGSKILGTDAAFRAELENALKKLPPLKIGADGTIQEWIEDYKEKDPKHRHVSHLLGLHPFSTISPETPAHFEAARKTLERRGAGKDVGWSSAWKIGFYARLHDGQQSHQNLTRLMRKNLYPNLMLAVWPNRVFNIDASFGATAGIAEMLLQSHAGTIHLLPALPAQWPDGSVKGLKARGGFVVDIEWAGGKLTRTTIHSLAGKPCVVRFGDETRKLHLEKGGTQEIR